MLRVKNFVPAISLEGFEAATDGRRGERRLSRRLSSAIELLQRKKLLYGISACYTSANFDSITSEAFYDELIRAGRVFHLVFPLYARGQRRHVPPCCPHPSSARKPLSPHSSLPRRQSPCSPWTSRTTPSIVGGCIAGGRRYLHINANGDVDPCVFIHYSDSNIREKSLLDALRSPMLMAYHDGQPFNENMLRPCPMLENPEKLRAMVAASGAHSTDLQSPESADHLCAKCDEYAARWKGTADELWTQLQAEKAAKKAES